ncbi:caspase-3-like [Ornithodoros turicata]|uniref:caspase-3-like n=1 Tax=Ornithodoros turicata TaxID=34597 RepID=UPI003139109F
MERYHIWEGRKGLCIILDITVFRTFAHRDAREGFMLAERFCKLGFTTTHITGYVSEARIIEEMKGVTKWITECDSLLIVCVMSHGERGSIISSEECRVPLQSIINVFNNQNCPNLKGKPRLFFIEACQNDEIEPEKKKAGDDDSDDSDDEEGCYATWDYKIVLPADFFLSFGTPPGYVAWWTDCKGSPYLAALLKELPKGTGYLDNEKETYASLTQLLTTVASSASLFDVSDNMCDPSQQGDVVKQMPCYVSTLTKRLFL